MCVDRDESPAFVLKWSKAGPIVDSMHTFIREYGPRLRACWVEERRPNLKESQTETWNNGRIYGIVCGALEAMNVEYESIPPTRWWGSFSEDPYHGDSEHYVPARNKIKKLLKEYTGIARMGATALPEAACMALLCAWVDGGHATGLSHTQIDPPPPKPVV